MSHDHVVELFHLCIELVVDVVAVPCFRLTNIGSELVEALTQGLILLMESFLRDEEVVLGDIVAIVTLLLEKWVRRRAWPIHHNQVG